MFEIIKNYILWGFGFLFIVFILITIYCCLVIAHECSEKENKDDKC